MFVVYLCERSDGVGERLIEFGIFYTKVISGDFCMVIFANMDGVLRRKVKVD